MYNTVFPQRGKWIWWSHSWKERTAGRRKHNLLRGGSGIYWKVKGNEDFYNTTVAKFV